MTTPHDIQPLPKPAFVRVVNSDAGSVELQDNFTVNQIQSVARAAIDHHMAQLVARAGVMPASFFAQTGVNDTERVCNSNEVREAIAAMQAKIEQVEGENESLQLRGQELATERGGLVDAITAVAMAESSIEKSEALDDCILMALELENIDAARSKT